MKTDILQKCYNEKKRLGEAVFGMCKGEKIKDIQKCIFCSFYTPDFFKNKRKVN